MAVIFRLQHLGTSPPPDLCMGLSCTLRYAIKLHSLRVVCLCCAVHTAGDINPGLEADLTVVWGKDVIPLADQC